MNRILCFAVFSAFFLCACSTPFVTNTSRSNVEQMLISSAIEHGIGKIDFSNYTGKKVFMDYSLLAPQVDKEFLQAYIQYHLANYRITTVKDESQADFIFQPSCAVLATDVDKILVGTPALPIPVPDTDISIVIPELPLFMKSTRSGHGRFFFTILNAKTLAPVETMPGSTAVTKYTNWAILLIPFKSHSSLPSEDDRALKEKYNYFWEE